MNIFKATYLFGLGLAMQLSAVVAQDTQTSEPFPEAVNTVQIIDTSILFAIGAREAEQAIRGSFGWPTFQEGFVDQVYFRFDPDGYARFSPSPRLDDDVFEVVCAQSATACLAQKGNLQLGLSQDGRLIIRIEGLGPQDRFFLRDRNTEIPMPPTILEPLDFRMESLLYSGDHLVVKREAETLQETSLAGLFAVGTYLRWVAYGQSSDVFPREWPVPAPVSVDPNLANLGQNNLQQSGGFGATNIGAVSNFNQQAQGQLNAPNVRTQQTQDLANANRTGVTSGIATGASNTFQPNDPSGNIADLQRELEQLRLELNGRNANNQPAQTQEIEGNGQGFAQQAQARTLGVSTPIQSRALQAQRTYLSQANVTPSSPDQMMKFTEHLTQIENRLIALENMMTQLAHDLKENMRLQMAHQTQLEKQAFRQKPSPKIGLPAETNMDQLSDLESKLLERIDQRSQLPETDPFQADTAMMEQKKILESLLVKLGDLEDAPQPENPEMAEEPAPEEDVQAEATADQEGGFISLTDYINQVLKKEEAGATQ